MVLINSETILAARAELAKRELQRRSLFHFFQRGFQVLEPGRELKLNWHHELICQELEKISRGEINRLLINIPPRYSKSTIVSVCFPCWEWIGNPWLRYLILSYSHTLSTTHSLNRRAIITSDWYQNTWSDRFSLAADQNMKSEFMNDQRGLMTASSLSAGVLGKGGERILIDDPHSPIQAESDVQREAKITAFDNAIATRLNDKVNGAVVVVMQRLHESDVSGHILADIGGYEHLCIPMEAEVETTYFLSGGRTVVRKPGDLLHPERDGPEEIALLKKTLGSYAYAGQMQQSPSPAGGGMFKRHSFLRWERLWRDWDDCCITVDAAFKGTTTSDYVVIQSWARKDSKFYLLDQIRDRMGIVQTENAIVTMINRFPQAKARIIEDKANGPAIIERLSRNISGIIAYNPGKDSKESRATAIVPLVEAQNILLPPDADWVEEYIEEFVKFPKSVNDDQVDATVMALDHLELKKYDFAWLKNL